MLEPRLDDIESFGTLWEIYLSQAYRQILLVMLVALCPVFELARQRFRSCTTSVPERLRNQLDFMLLQRLQLFFFDTPFSANIAFAILVDSSDRHSSEVPSLSVTLLCVICPIIG